MLQTWILGRKRLELREVPVPKPEPGEVVIRVEAATTCGTDLKLYRRGHHPKIPIPGPFGHEYTGTVVDIGEGVELFKPGDPVIGVNTGPCQACSFCRRGLWNHCETLFDEMVIGTYAEFVKIPARVVQTNLHLRPSGVSPIVAPMVEPLASVLHGMLRLSPKPHERGMVIGSGTLGILFSLLLQNLGVEVVLVGRNPRKNRWAQEIGVQQVIETPPKNSEFDFVIECTGNPEVWSRALSWTRPGGRVLLFGGLPKNVQIPWDAHDLHYGERVLIGTFHFTPQEVQHAVHLIASQNLPFERLITRTYPLTRVVEAFEALDRGEGLKFVIQP